MTGLKRAIEILVVTIVVAVSTLTYLLKYLSSPLLFGIDGPYYYVQVSSLLTTGSLKYPDPPLAFYILAGFTVMLGGNVTLGVKVGSVIVTMLAAYALYYIVRSVAGPEAGTATIVLYTFSPYLVRMCFDLIKNAMGLTFLALTLLLTYKAISRRKKAYSALATVSLVATGITHVLDFAVSYSAVLLLLILHIRDRERYKYIVPPAVAGSLVLALGFVSYSIMGGDPYKGLAFLGSLAREGVEAEEIGLRVARVIYPLVTGLAGLLLSLKLKGEARAVTLTLSLLIIALNMPVYPQQYVWRFNLMTAVLAPPIIGIALGSIREAELKILLALIIVGLVAPQFISQLQRSGPSIPLGEYYEIKDFVAKLPENAVIVAPDIKLRYWLETMSKADIVKSPAYIEGRGPAILLVENRMLKTLVRLPPVAKPIYRGKFISAYLIPPHR